VPEVCTDLNCVKIGFKNTCRSDGGMAIKDLTEPLDPERLKIRIQIRLFLGPRVETKIFVFVFSQKFRDNLLLLFAKKAYKKL
jgi:hypothetical protein